MFCANCGTKQNEGEKFCPNCGTRFEIVTPNTSKVDNGKVKNVMQPKVNKSSDVKVKTINNKDNERSTQIKSKKASGIDKKNNETVDTRKKTNGEENIYERLVWKNIDTIGSNDDFYQQVYLTLQTGIISDVIKSTEVKLDLLEYTYFKHNTTNGRIEFFFVLKDNKTKINELEQKIKSYNIKARKNNYNIIKFDKDMKTVEGRFVRKNLGFLESILSWNAELDFEEILNLCKSIRRTK